MLSVVAGPMFSQKTSFLVAKLTLHADVQKDSKCLIINSSKDIRDPENKVSSHSSSYKGVSYKVDIQSVLKLSEADVENYNVIGIDEAQFFDDLHDNVKKWLDNGKFIYVVGLDSDCMGNPFGDINKLLYMSDEFVKTQSLCTKCAETSKNISEIKKAPFTARISNSVDLIEVGAHDYIPMCRKHFQENLMKYK